MTAASLPIRQRRGGALLVAVLLLAAAGTAWLATAVVSRRMGLMPGTMGLSFPAFLPVWALMMAAMMLPSVTPVASLYARTMQADRYLRLPAFAAGYLGVWVSVGVPAYLLSVMAGRLAPSHPTGATAFAAALFAVCGIYQLTPLKDRCLARCRSPLALLFHYASFKGRLRDVKAGLHHAAFCVACCWTLMALLVAFGLMNLLAMLGLAGIVALEKLAPRGQLVARMTGLAALALAVAVVFVPALAPGLHAPVMTGSG